MTGTKFQDNYDALVIHRCQDGRKLDPPVAYGALTADEQALIRECSDDLVRYSGFIAPAKLHWTRTEFPWPPR